MRKLRLLAIMIVVFMMMSIIPTSAFVLPLRFSDVKNDYWGKASIDYVSSKGYMVGYGDEFGILDNVTEGQYLAVLCRIFGYENQSPLTVEGPARELGLLQKNDVVNVTKNLSRGDIAKYTIRAFELLNPNVKYPDYLDAYKPMMKDFNTIDEDLKTIALKCVEKGLLAGGSDGKFNPEDETTRAQAAAFIHRILEQSERNKVMPIFATPDLDFEKLMNSPEAENYVSPYDISRVVDGKILWKIKSGNGEEYLLPSYYKRDVNKTLYEALKTFTADAKRNNNYINARYLFLADNPSVKFTYYACEAIGRYDGGQYNLLLRVHADPYVLDDKGGQKLNTDYYWEIMSLAASYYYEWEDMDELVRKKGKLEEFMTPLNNIFNTIYDKNVAEYLYNYSIAEWDKCWDAIYTGVEYSNDKKLYIEKFDLEIQNYLPFVGGSPKFGTNDVGQ